MGARTVYLVVALALIASFAAYPAEGSPSPANGTASVVQATPVPPASNPGQPQPPSQVFKETHAPVIELYEAAQEGQPAQPSEQTPASAAQPEAPPPAAPEQPVYWRRIMQGLDNPAGGGTASPQEGTTAASPANENGAALSVGAGAPAGLPGGGDLGASLPGPNIRVYLKALYGLCVALFLVLVGSYLVRRYGGRSPLFAGASLGTVLGRIYLNPRACLHLVRIGDKVLVVGVTPNTISTLAEFEATSLSPNPAAPAPPVKQLGGFLSQLRAATARFSREEPREFDETELASLRDDIQRLQRTLRESSNESEE